MFPSFYIKYLYKILKAFRAFVFCTHIHIYTFTKYIYKLLLIKKNIIYKRLNENICAILDKFSKILILCDSMNNIYI